MVDFEAAKKRLLASTPAAGAWLIPIAIPQGMFSETGQNLHVDFLGIRAFKALDVRSIESSAIKAVFSSSGSTAGANRPGRHLLGDTGILAYRHTACAGYRAFLKRHQISPSSPFLSLVPRPEEWPDSSLAAMISFLALGGFPVTWITTQELAGALATLAAERGSQNESVIVFGTSLHHHLVSCNTNSGQRIQPSFNPQDQAYKGTPRSLVVVDTGGAKGKTAALAPGAMQQLLLETYSQEIFGQWAEVLTASEYGMCELASQAWSAPGDLRHFFPSPGLSVVAVNPRTLTSAAPGEPGLLGFVDQANTDSYPAILTEDVGIVDLDGSFSLIGRAPMASVKGCSLRIGGLSALSTSSKPPERVTKSPLTTNSQPLHATPRPECFTQREWVALEQAWTSCTASMHLLKERRPAQRLLIVSAANASIALLYPLCAAWEQGFGTVTVQIPSVRDDDPLAATIVQQLDWIMSWAAANFKNLDPNELIIERSSNIGSIDDLEMFHTALIFGTDETLAVFARAFEGKGVRLIGFGDVRNSIWVGPDSCPRATAETTLAWRGRGCLTPVLLVIENALVGPARERFIIEFSNAFFEIHKEEFALVPDRHLDLYHWHTIHELKARLGKGIVIATGQGAGIVDLRSLDAATMNLSAGSGLDLGLAGQGLIFMIDQDGFERWMEIRDKPLGRQQVNPGYLSPHQGATWRQWLDVTKFDQG